VVAIIIIAAIFATAMREIQIFCNWSAIFKCAAKINKRNEEIKLYRIFFRKNELFSTFCLTIAILL